MEDYNDKVKTQGNILFRDTMNAYGKVQKRIQYNRARTFLNQFTAFASIACVVILLIYVFKEKEYSSDIQRQNITIQSNAGMRTQFNLPDGTIVHLNSGSKLSYQIPYNEKERRVKMTGEAYFKVAQDENRPFIVDISNDLSIKVLGTEFNVEAYEEDMIVNTTLVKGSLKLLYNNSNGYKVEQILKPSEKITYDAVNRKATICRSLDTSYETAWMEGKILLKNTPLSEMLRKLTHYYNVDFKITDPVITTYLFTGAFDNRQLLQVLDYLKISSGINYSIVQNAKDDSDGINKKTVLLGKKKS